MSQHIGIVPILFLFTFFHMWIITYLFNSNRRKIKLIIFWLLYFMIMVFISYYDIYVYLCEVDSPHGMFIEVMMRLLQCFILIGLLGYCGVGDFYLNFIILVLSASVTETIACVIGSSVPFIKASENAYIFYYKNYPMPSYIYMLVMYVILYISVPILLRRFINTSNSQGKLRYKIVAYIVFIISFLGSFVRDGIMKLSDLVNGNIKSATIIFFIGDLVTFAVAIIFFVIIINRYQKSEIERIKINNAQIKEQLSKLYTDDKQHINNKKEELLYSRVLLGDDVVDLFLNNLQKEYDEKGIPFEISSNNKESMADYLDRYQLISIIKTLILDNSKCKYMILSFRFIKNTFIISLEQDISMAKRIGRVKRKQKNNVQNIRNVFIENDADVVMTITEGLACLNTNIMLVK